MRPQVRSELLKLGSTRTMLGLAAAMTALIATAVVLHGYGLAADDLATGSTQLSFLIGWGAVFGALFAGLLGAMSLTSEITHGTIRPTLLATPRRHRVLAAKAVASAIAGAGFGIVATTTASLAGTIGLGLRGVDSALGTGDYVQFIVGGAVAAALWGVLGLGIGTMVRAQVPAVVGILAWVLFVEGILIENAPDIGRLAPSAVGRAISGLQAGTLLAPTPAFGLLALYGLAALTAARVALTRRDVA